MYEDEDYIKRRREHIIQKAEAWPAATGPVEHIDRKQWYAEIESDWVNIDIGFGTIKNAQDMLGLKAGETWPGDMWDSLRMLVVAQLKEAWGVD